MDWALFKLIVDRDMIYTKKVGLHLMGEPLLYPKIVDAIWYLRKRGIAPELATNGTVMSRVMAEDLIMAGLETIWFSVDSSNKELYESIRVGAKFENVVRNVLTFLEVNELQGSPVNAYVQKIGPVTNEDDNNKFIEMWGDYARVKFMDSWAGTMNLDKIASPPSHRFPCEEPWKRVAVLVNGDVVPCCRDWNGKYVYGNLQKASLEEIWYGPKIELLRQDILSESYSLEPCGSCNEWYIPMDRELVYV